MSTTTIILSIQPQHGERILDGKKTVELRRVGPKVVKEGDLALLYFSTPIKAVVGAFRINSLVVDEPQKLWLRLGHATCVSKAFYRKYVADTKSVCGIVVDKAWRLRERITLMELRNKIPGFTPPQSFRYLKPKEAYAILRSTTVHPHNKSNSSPFVRSSENDSSSHGDQSTEQFLPNWYQLPFKKYNL